MIQKSCRFSDRIISSKTKKTGVLAAQSEAIALEAAAGEQHLVGA
jgi:hypothetical protein